MSKKDLSNNSTTALAVPKPATTAVAVAGTSVTNKSNGALSNGTAGSAKSYESLKAQLRKDIFEFSLMERKVTPVALRMGRTLRRIRDSKEYKSEYPTYTAFIRHEYGRDRYWAHRALEVAYVCDLLPTGNIDESNLPNMRFFRGLGKYRKDPSLLLVAYRAKLAGENVKRAVQAALPPSETEQQPAKPLTKVQQRRLEREERKRKDSSEGLLFAISRCAVWVDNIGISDFKAFVEANLNDAFGFERPKFRKLLRLTKELERFLESKNYFRDDGESASA